jgi:23S rRNA (uracil1939-C5)-methyltransferase
MTQNVKFEKIVGGGKALGYVDGKPWFAAGPLPGEVAEVAVLKEKAGFVEAAVTRIVALSERRTGEAEAHYLLCSPWQNVEYDYQLELKRGMLADAFSRMPDVTITGVAAAPEQFNYRNKLEFSPAQVDGGVQLAFHERGSYEGLTVLPEGCRLGTDDMNQAALGLAKRAGELKLGGYMETLTVRRSVATGELVGHIALHQVPKRDWSLLKTADLAQVVVSRVRRRVDHEVVWQSGEPKLTEMLGGIELDYPFDSFFQTNVKMFQKTLADIIKLVPENGRIVDLYCGVGTIGLTAAKTAREVLGVEINPSAVALAKENAARAGLENYEALAVPAQILDAKLLAGTDCAIVDPPRAGLEQRLVRTLLEAAPARIVYLSCNPVTQARDVQLLSEKYAFSEVKGFDMYPGTLHLESLMVLERR